MRVLFIALIGSGLCAFAGCGDDSTEEDSGSGTTSGTSTGTATGSPTGTCDFTPRRYSFTVVGIGGGGRMLVPAISPAAPNLLLVGCDMSGLYRSTDAGLTWDMIDWRKLNYPSATLFHPTDPNRVYAYGIAGIGPSGLFLSQDQGQNWELVASYYQDFGERRITTLYADRGNPDLMFAGGDVWDTGDPAAFRSTDAGETWEPIAGIEGVPLSFVVAQPSPVNQRMCFIGSG